MGLDQPDSDEDSEDTESLTLRAFDTKPAEIQQGLISSGNPSWPALIFLFLIVNSHRNHRICAGLVKNIRKNLSVTILSFALSIKKLIPPVHNKSLQ